MRGIIYAILATISYSSTPTFTQLGYKGGIQTDTLLFSRHLVSLVFLIPSIIKNGSFKTVGRDQIPGLTILGLFSIFGAVSFNYAYRYLPNMIATAISITYIVFVFIIEMLLGREKYTMRRGVIILLTIIGLVIIALPGSSISFPMKAFWVGIGAALLYSTQLALINSKKLRQVPSDIIVLTGAIPVMIFSSVRCFIFGVPLLPSGGLQWFAIICLGTVGVILARGLFYSSLRLLGATKASMIDSMEPFTSAVLGYVFLRQGISLNMVVGSLLMVISIVLLLREKSPKPQNGPKTL